MAFSFLSGVLFVEFVCSVVAATDSLDLYVRFLYRKSHDPTTRGDCAECGATDGCVVYRTYLHIQNECERRYSSDMSQAISRKYTLTGGVDQPLEETYYKDTFCSTSDKWFEETYQFAKCHVESRDNVEFYVLRNWCVASSTPIDDFTTPMARYKNFVSESDCLVDTEKYYEYFVPDDEALCFNSQLSQPLGLEQADGLQYVLRGSEVSYCQAETDGSMSLQHRRYSDSFCTQQDSGIVYTEGRVVEGCGSGGYSRRRAECHEPPKYHCKPLYETAFGSRVGAGGGDDTDSNLIETGSDSQPNGGSCDVIRQHHMALACLEAELSSSQAQQCTDCLDDVVDSLIGGGTPLDYGKTCDEITNYVCDAFHTACDDICIECRDEIEANYLCIAESVNPQCGGLTCKKSAAPAVLSWVSISVSVGSLVLMGIELGWMH